MPADDVPPVPPLPTSFGPAELAGIPGGPYTEHLGIRLVELGPDIAAAAFDTVVIDTARALAAVEVTCSVGAAVWWGSSTPGGRAVGMSNHTTMFEPDATGPFLARAIPLHQGTVQQLWRCEITDAAGRACASGEVLVANLS